MASAAEQLAANINWSAFGKAEELKKRIWFTLGALVIFRLGTYIPLPGINADAFEQAFLGQKQGVLDLFNMFSGGAVQRMAIFALNIMPYISASIIIQLLSSVDSQPRDPEEGRRGGAQGAQSIHPLSLRHSGGVPGLWHFGRAAGTRRHRRRTRPVLHLVDRGDADRGHDVPRLARRADHLARRRQRLLADHFRGHRRAPARSRSSRRSNSAARARSRPAWCSAWSSWRWR